MIKYNTEDLLEEILRITRKRLNDTDGIMYIMPDNKYAITFERSISGYFVYPNYLRENGSLERMADGVQVELNDFAELLIKSVWCMEEFFK